MAYASKKEKITTGLTSGSSKLGKKTARALGRSNGRSNAKEKYIAKTPGEKKFHTYVRQMDAEWKIATEAQGASPSLQERGKRIVKKWKEEAMSGKKKKKNYTNQ